MKEKEDDYEYYLRTGILKNAEINEKKPKSKYKNLNARWWCESFLIIVFIIFLILFANGVFF